MKKVLLIFLFFLFVTVFIYLLNLENSRENSRENKIAVKPETRNLQKSNRGNSNELDPGQISNIQNSIDETHPCIEVEDFYKVGMSMN